MWDCNAEVEEGIEGGRVGHFGLGTRSERLQTDNLQGKFISYTKHLVPNCKGTEYT